MNEEQIKRFDELLETDMQMTEIAQELGMSYNTLRLRLSERGDKITRKRVNIAAEDRRRLARTPKPGSRVLVLKQDGTREDYTAGENGERLTVAA